jgi:hypothetical protein
MRYRWLRPTTLALVTLAVGPWAAQAESFRSGEPAQRLLRTLQQKQLTHAAAKDPAEAGRYVAAMRVGDGLLLVVSAHYAQPALLNERLYRGDFEGVYRELNAAGTREGKLFVQDLGQPGLALRRADGEPFDVVYEAVVEQTAFDGDWKAKKASKDDYRAACKAADQRYAAALEALMVAFETPAK